MPRRRKSWLGAIEKAEDWEDLSAILEAAQRAFQKGQLTQGQAEKLAIRAAIRAHQVPRDSKPIWAEDLLPEREK